MGSTGATLSYTRAGGRVEPARAALARRRPRLPATTWRSSWRTTSTYLEVVWAAQRSGLYYTPISSLLTHASSTTWSTTAAPSHWSRRRTSPTPRPGSVNGCRGYACACRRRRPRRIPAVRRRARPRTGDAGRAGGRRQRDVLLVRHDRAPQGRAQAAHPRTRVGGARLLPDLPRPVRVRRRHGVALVRPAVPRADRSTDASRRFAPEARSW